MPTVVPAMNAFFGPNLLMIMEAGINAIAVPIDITAMGRVARLLSSARSKPTRADKVATRTDEVWNRD